LYDAQNKTRLRAWTGPVNDYKAFSVDLEPSLKSYNLKVVLDTNDEESSNDFYSIRIDLEPLNSIE